MPEYSFIKDRGNYGPSRGRAHTPVATHHDHWEPARGGRGPSMYTMYRGGSSYGSHQRDSYRSRPGWYDSREEDRYRSSSTGTNHWSVSNGPRPGPHPSFSESTGSLSVKEFTDLTIVKDEPQTAPEPLPSTVTAKAIPKEAASEIPKVQDKTVAAPASTTGQRQTRPVSSSSSASDDDTPHEYPAYSSSSTPSPAPERQQTTKTVLSSQAKASAAVVPMRKRVLATQSDPATPVPKKKARKVSPVPAAASAPSQRVDEELAKTLQRLLEPARLALATSTAASITSTPRNGTRAVTSSLNVSSRSAETATPATAKRKRDVPNGTILSPRSSAAGVGSTTKRHRADTALGKGPLERLRRAGDSSSRESSAPSPARRTKGSRLRASSEDSASSSSSESEGDGVSNLGLDAHVDLQFQIQIQEAKVLSFAMKKREYKEKGNRAKERLRVLRRDLAASQSVETTRPAIPRGTQSASSSGSPAATLGAPLTSKSWTPKSLQTRDSLYDFQVTHSDRWTRKPRTLLLNDFNDLAVVSVLAGELHVYDTASRSPLKVIPHSDLNNYFSEHIAWLREGVLATAMVEKSSQTKPKREPVIDQALSLVYDCEVQRNGSFTYKVQHLTRNFPHEKGVTFILPLESSDDYTRWVTGSADKKICLWGYEGNFRGTPGGDYTPVATQPLHSLHTAMITAIHYNPHSQRLYSGGLDSRLIAWDIANEVNTLPYVALEGKGKIRDITAIPTHPNLMLIGFSDGSQTMKLWDERTKSFVLDLGQAEQGKNDNTRYTHPSVHPNGYLVASGLQTGQIAIYDLRHAGVDRGPTQLINAHSNRVVQTAFKTNRLDHGREQLLSIGNDCVLTYNSYRRALNERIQNVG